MWQTNVMHCNNMIFSSPCLHLKPNASPCAVTQHSFVIVCTELLRGLRIQVLQLLHGLNLVRISLLRNVRRITELKQFEFNFGWRKGAK